MNYLKNLLKIVCLFIFSAGFLFIGAVFSDAQTSITNQAQATYKDASGKQHGPISSNTVSTTKTSSPSSGFAISLTREGLQNQQAQVVLRIYSASTNQLVKEMTITVDSAGSNSNVTNPTEPVAGQSYNFVLRVPYCLTKKISNRQWPLSQPLSFGAVLAGNLNNTDNIVNSLDWSIMNTRWRTNDQIADINRDGIVNTVDWGFMNKNWFVSGQE